MFLKSAVLSTFPKHTNIEQSETIEDISTMIEENRGST